MTDGQIIEMARRAGFNVDQGFLLRVTGIDEDLARFAKLVAEKAWSEGYKQGIEDERTSESNIGIAGFNMKIEPARKSPYAIRGRGEV